MKIVKCWNCLKVIEIANDTYYHGIKRNPGDPKFYCKECYKLIKSKRMKSYTWNNLTKEQQESNAKKRKEKWDNLSEEKKEELKRKQSERMKKKFKELSEEEKEEWREFARNIYNNLSDNKKEEFNQKARNRWNNMSPEELKIHGQKISNWYNSLSDEEKIEYANKRKEWYENLSVKEKEAHAQYSRNVWINMSDEYKINYSNQKKEWYRNLPDELKQEYIHRKTKWYHELPEEERESIANKLRNYYNNLSDEKKYLWSKRSIDQWNNMSNEEKIEWAKNQRDRWNNLPIEERVAITKKKLSLSGKINKLNKKFEETFNSSHLVNDYYFKQEEVLTNDNNIHSWDYGIYDKNTNELVMVVDLDGAYYHADNCDYDGLHSKEEYDERRSLSIPSNINHFIIQELNFSKCFELLVKTLMMNYDEYVDYIFNMCRSMPFPSPHYSDDVLIKSFHKLKTMKCNDKYHQNISLNTRVGDRLIQHFHSSIYQAKRKGNISPYEAWYDDKILRECIENRIIYQTYLNPNKILQGFNVSKVAQKVSVFSAGRAKMLIYKYLNEYNEIFDPFSGFSGRMLGAVSLGKRYIGQDISEIHTRESNEIIKFLNINNSTVTCKNILESSGTYECLFTCSPYSDKEQWFTTPVSKRTCDDWIDECISRFKCKKYLFVVDDTKRYNDYIVDEIVNKSHLNKNSEYVILIERT